MLNLLFVNGGNLRAHKYNITTILRYKMNYGNQ